MPEPFSQVVLLGHTGYIGRRLAAAFSNGAPEVPVVGRSVTELDLTKPDASLHYPLPLHQQEAYRHLQLADGAFPVTETAAQEIVSLPMYPEMEPDQVDYVLDTLAEFFRGRPVSSHLPAASEPSLV